MHFVNHVIYTTIHVPYLGGPNPNIIRLPSTIYYDEWNVRLN